MPPVSRHDGGVTTAVELHVSGRVQGVSFRAATQQEAERLGVTGWVRNEPDGSVAVHAEGAQGDVDALVAWCRRGPSGSRVRNVAVREAAVGGHRDFAIRY
jgi:acylphosphatase